MKRHAGLILMFFMITAPAAADHFELVESIPVETSLENADIRNTAEVWAEMISDAEYSLDFGQFYISHKEGEALTPILDAVYHAADRGVKVRFIIDGNMYNTYPGTADALNEYGNISVRTYDLENLNGGVLHAKYFIVDGKTLFLGSQNFDWRALRHIHELGIRISDRDLANFYREIFELDWRLAAPEADVRKIAAAVAHDRDLKTFELRSKEYGKITAVPTASNPEIIYHLPNWDETQLLDMIRSAESSIRIQLLSYSPLSREGLYEHLDFALRKAAARGVHVQMILSDWNFYSPRIEYIKSLHAIPNIDIKFSTIPEASEGYIGYARVEHCKFMVVDDKAFWLGTSNWSESYFYRGRNLGIVLENEKLSGRVGQIFLKSWNSEYCRRVELGRIYERKETRE